MNPPSKSDVLAACREPQWPTAAEVAACIESGRQVNAFVMAPEARPVVKKRREEASLLKSLIR